MAVLYIYFTDRDVWGGLWLAADCNGFKIDTQLKSFPTAKKNFPVLHLMLTLMIFSFIICHHLSVLSDCFQSLRFVARRRFLYFGRFWTSLVVRPFAYMLPFYTSSQFLFSLPLLLLSPRRRWHG